MLTLTSANLIALYAPLAGLILMALWVGALGNRMKVSERRQSKTEADIESLKNDKVTLGVLLEKASTSAAAMEKMQREMSGMQRSLANIASGHVPGIVKFDQNNDG